MSGKAGVGRVTETAGVRGIDESDLKSAAFDAAQLDAMTAQRVDGPAAAGYAEKQDWDATLRCLGRRGRGASPPSGGAAAAAKAETVKAVGGLLGSLGGGLGSGLARCGGPEADTEVRGRACRRGTRARPRNHRTHPRRAAVVERCRRAAARQPGRTLGGLADEQARAAVDLRRDRHARGQRLRRARRFHPAHARPVPAAVDRQRARGGARPRDQPLRAARPLRRDPQAGDGELGQGARDEQGRSATAARRPPMRAATWRSTARRS